MRRLTRRKFVAVSQFATDSIYGDRVIDNVVDSFRKITGTLPTPDTYPCPYYLKCGEACLMSKAYNCDGYKRYEKLRRLGLDYGR